MFCNMEQELKPINKMASIGLTSHDDWLGEQAITPLTYHKFKAFAVRSKKYRTRHPGKTASERQDLLAIELGARDYSQYRACMINLGLWKESNGKQRLK